jgi:hypothetical protein
MKKTINYIGLSLLLTSCSATNIILDSSYIEPDFHIEFDTYFDIELEMIKTNNENKYSITFPIPQKYSYTFDGWYFDKEYKNPLNISKLNKNTVLYLKWTLPKIEDDYILNKLIILPETDYDKIEVEKILERLKALGNDIITNTYDYGTRLYLINTKLTDHPDWLEYKGTSSPNGVLLDELPGAGNVNKNKQAYSRIGYSELGKGHGALNLELHELAHLINYAYKEQSKTELFNNIWQKEKDKAREMLMINGHYDREEYFCEMFSYYFYSFETRRLVYYHAPETYNFMKERFSWGGN